MAASSKPPVNDFQTSNFPVSAQLTIVLSTVLTRISTPMSIVLTSAFFPILLVAIFVKELIPPDAKPETAETPNDQ